MNKSLVAIYKNSFFRYLWTGGAGFILDIGILHVLHYFFHVHYQLATFVGFMVGLVVVYLLSNTWVFSRRKLKDTPVKEFIIFSLIGIVGLGFTHLLMWLFFERFGLDITYAKCLTTMLVLIWNYGARKIIIY